MPLLGVGAYNMYGSEAEASILTALETGYRLIDTATMYQNEKEVGHAVRTSAIPRNEIFVTTKVANNEQGYDETLEAFDTSLKTLQLDYIDLYLVHWPIKKSRKETWRALEKIYSGGQVRSIGVANYLVPFLEEQQTYSDIPPAVNQVEFSPYLFDGILLDYCIQHRIQLQAYSPLIRGKKMADPRLEQLAKKYQRTKAQILLRWDIDLGVSPIPKSMSLARQQENFSIFDFHLDAEDIEWMKTFHDGTRVADDPMIFL